MSPIENTKPFRGVLENWKVFDFFGGSDKVATGNIFGDGDRFEDGTYIRTSAIVKLDYENNKLETLNSIYELGKEYK